jgi:uncharacterized membrane protein YphA (DoxX/SURF4 family)
MNSATLNAIAETKTAGEALRGKPSPSTFGFLIVEIIIGYEWFVSGLTKVIRGDFTSGLADEMAEKSAEAVGWYADLLNGVVIPNAAIFGYLIEIDEILIGALFIIGPLLWLITWQRVPERLRALLFLLTALAATGGVFMAFNFHLANGLTHPWLIPADSLDEGVDFDTFLGAMNIVIAAVNIAFFNSLRRGRTDDAAAIK